jgi:hypothetical protein
MFLFNAKTALWQSFRTHFAESNYAFVHFYTGAIPETFEDIPFDHLNMFEVCNNSKYSQLLEPFHGKPGGTTADAVTRFVTNKRLGGVRQHSLMERWNKWRLIPRDMYSGQYHNLDRTPVGDNPAWQTSETELRELHFAYRYANQMRGDERDRRQYSANWGGGIPSNRSAQNAPLICKYEQEVTIDSFEYFSWSSANNTPGTVAVEYWDPTLLEGAGDWVISDAGIQVYDTFYSRRVIDLAGPITSTQFRFRFGDTGSSSWAFQYFWPLGLEPTWGKDPIDITWALVGGWHGAFDSYTARNQYDCFEQPEGQYPFMLVDVGPPGSGATIELEQTVGLTGNDEPLIQKFDIEFLDELI